MIPIPAILLEALTDLASQLSEKEKHEIRECDEEEFVMMSHMSAGMALRNEWLYPTDSPLWKCFSDDGLFHEDDMSEILLRSFYRYLKGEDIRYGEQLDKKPRYGKSIHC